jgi:hypothetical protein
MNSENPFNQIPQSMLPIIAGLCDHPDDQRSDCLQCALTLEINRFLDAGMPGERLFYVLVRLAAEAIGGSAGGELKHQMLIMSFCDLLALTIGVVQGQALEERKNGGS